MDNMEQAISLKQISKLRKSVESDPKGGVMKNAIIANGIETVAFNHASQIGLQNNFSHEIKSGKITSQEKSGRCWMFAGLNLFRTGVMEKLQLDNFEFSLNYPMFFDKLEKANYFLESIIRTLNEDIYSRIIMWLLKDPLQDGGQWDMFTALLKKYGAVPNSIMPETFHSSNSAVMNQLLTAKLREWAAQIRQQFSAGKSQEELRLIKADYLKEFYTLLTYFLGDPPITFDFEFRNNKGEHTALKVLEPQGFFKDFVEIDFDDYVSIIHVPTPDKPYNQTYTIDYLGNLIEGKKVSYLNLSLDELKEATIKQISADEPVWFGCDIRLQTEKKKGLMDSRAFLYDHTLGTSFSMDKADRLLYGDSLLTHAMVISGVHISDGKPSRWKVENSWGEERGEKGFFLMSDSWFDEYTYQVVIHKKFLRDEHRELLKLDPVILPPWDPIGSLAKSLS